MDMGAWGGALWRGRQRLPLSIHLLGTGVTISAEPASSYLMRMVKIASSEDRHNPTIGKSYHKEKVLQHGVSYAWLYLP